MLALAQEQHLLRTSIRRLQREVTARERDKAESAALAALARREDEEDDVRSRREIDKLEVIRASLREEEEVRTYDQSEGSIFFHDLFVREIHHVTLIIQRFTVDFIGFGIGGATSHRETCGCAYDTTVTVFQHGSNDHVRVTTMTL